MSKGTPKTFVCFALVVMFATCLTQHAAAQTPLAPGSIQVSRIQYDGNSGNNYVSPYGFPEIFNDQAGCNTENDICNIAGIEGSVYIDQFSSVPAAPVAGTLSLPSTGAPAAYPTVEPGSYLTSSFSSKSEGALMLSPNANFLTYMGYQAGDQLDDASNGYSPNPNYQLVPNTYTDSNGNPYPFYDREVALIGASGLVSLTPIDNAFSGDNPRAAITVDGNEFYMGGNSDSTEFGKTVITGPGLTIGARCGIPENNVSYQLGTYSAVDRPDESAKKHIKDNNWRGVGIYNDANGHPQLYVSKGSGSNGDDGVFQVGSSLPVCTAGGTDTNATITPVFSAPVTNQTTGAATPYLPFGFWFANPTTLYVADEGNSPSYTGGSSPSFSNATNGTYVPSNDPYAGLEKWSLVNGTWTLDYTLQAGLNLDQPQTFAGYNDINGDPIPSYTYGLRNMTGYVNGDGTVTIYAITAQFSAASGGEPDPDSLVGITDSLAATTLPANEQFVTLQTSTNQEVFRGVAYIPPTPGFTRATQTINFTSVGSVTFGAAPITLVATATSGWPISYSVTSGPATVSGNTLTITGAGSVTVAASQSGNTDYAPATASQTFTVAQATPTVTWSTPFPIVYGTPLSGTQLNATASVAGSFTYTPTAGTVLTAGTQMLSVLFTPTDATDYTTATGSVMLQVNQATPSVTWATPAPITYGTALSGTQLNATGSVAGSFVYTPTAGTVLGAGSQPLSVLFTPTDTTDYTTATGSVSIQVNRATPSVTWTTPAPITYGTPLSGTQLNATASVAGSFAYTPTAGTVLGAGSQLLSVLFTPADATDYTTANASVNLTVTQASQSISFTINAPGTAAYGTSFTVAASATSGLAVTYTSAGSCTNSGATYTITSGSGTCTVKASQAGNSNYLAATPVSQSTAATKASQTVSFTGAPATATYGSTFTVVATSNSGITPLITTSAACSIVGSTVTMKAATGTCTLTANWNGNSNYLLASATQATTAEKATPIITWPTPAPITYGTALSAAQLDATANVPGRFVYTPRSGMIEGAGTVTLSVTFTPTSRTDYNDATATVPLQVLQAPTTTTITSPSPTVTMNVDGVATAILDFNVVSYKPMGAVTLTASTGEVCSGTVSAVSGNGSCKLTFTTTGTRTIIASYGGDSNHLGSNSSSQSPAVTVTVNPH